MQRQVLEGFDLRGFPTTLLRPVNGQHVIRKLFSENQAGRLGLWLACRAAFKDQIGRLSWRRGTEIGGAKEEADETEAKRATDTSDVFKRLLAEHAFKLVGQSNRKQEYLWIRFNQIKLN